MQHNLNVQSMVRIALFAALIAICAWISIPSAIPITMQTFAVFLAVLVLGGRQGTLCVAVYLLLGAVGLPVFSLFRGGPAVLLGPGGGYLLGFLPSALTLWCAERWSGKHLRRQTVAAALALLVCYTFGTLWYAAFFLSDGSASLPAVLASCVLPFILPDTLKFALALFLARRLNLRKNS